MTTENRKDGLMAPIFQYSRIRRPGRGRTYNLSALLSLTRELTGLFAPVQPRAEFRNQLHQSLMSAARQKQAQRALALGDASAIVPDRLPSWLRQEDGRVDRRWVIGAAAVGSAVSMAGAVLAIVLHQRGRNDAAA